MKLRSHPPSAARLLFGFFVFACGCCAQNDAAALLAAVKSATGGGNWDRIKTMHVKAVLRLGNLTGTYESWADFHRLHLYSDQRFSSTSLGSLRTQTGWNGKVSWTADQTGDVCIAASEEARRRAAGQAFVETFGYLFSSKFHALTARKPDRQTDAGKVQVIELHPVGLDPLELEIDPVTHTVRRLQPLTGIDKEPTVYRDFRSFGGLLVPFQWRQAGAAVGVSVSVSVTSITVDETPPTGIFDPPQAALTGLEFPAGRNSVTVKFRYDDDEIYLPVSINGQPQANFVFDTGSTNTLAASKARELGLKVEAVGVSYGGGPDSVPAGLTKVNRIDIGELTMKNQVIDTTVLPGFVDGTLGYELARRAVVTIDYAAQSITFTKPEFFRKPAHAAGIPFQFAETSQVLIRASVNGIAGDFQLDTGQDSGLTVNRPFAERNGLFAAHGVSRTNPSEGIGGTTEMATFEPKSFTMAGFSPTLTEAEIFTARSGSGVQEHVAATIGNKVLEQFVVTLDYVHRMVYLEKNPAHREKHGASTITMTRPESANKDHGWPGFLELIYSGGNALEVTKIAADGPAAQAGILTEDRITSINGTPVDKLSLRDAVGALIAAPGAAVRLTVKRSAQTLEFTFRTI